MQSTEQSNLAYQQAIADKTLPGRAVLASRALFYTVMAMVLCGFAWAALTKVDVVVEARGRLTVEEEPLRISAAEPARVDEVAVHVGDHVKAGQLLMRMDSFHAASEARRLQAERDAARAEAARWRSAATAAHAARPLIERELKLANDTEKMLEQQITIVRNLSGEFTSGELQHRQIELQDARSASAKAQLALDHNAQEEVDANAQASGADSNVEALGAQWSQADEAQRRTSILSPVDGTVTQLAAAHPGVVIGLTEPAAVLIPDGPPLTAEVRIPNGSMRRLTPGMTVRLRFDAFPHEDFGYLGGKLAAIDPDTDSDGLYHAWVRLDRTEMPGPQGSEKLRPGLQLDARIVVARESLLHLLLRPVRRLAEPLAVNQ